ERIAAEKRAAEEARRAAERQLADKLAAEAAAARQSSARIAKETDRDALMRIASAAPAERAAVEQRLASLGFVRVIAQGVSHWRKPGAGEPFRDCPDCPSLVVIPVGRVLMGSPAGAP